MSCSHGGYQLEWCQLFMEQYWCVIWFNINIIGWNLYPVYQVVWLQCWTSWEAQETQCGCKCCLWQVTTFETIKLCWFRLRSNIFYYYNLFYVMSNQWSIFRSNLIQLCRSLSSKHIMLPLVLAHASFCSCMRPITDACLCASTRSSILCTVQSKCKHQLFQNGLLNELILHPWGHWPDRTRVHPLQIWHDYR